MAVAYADLSFATGKTGHEYVRRVCCMYENVKTNVICEREIDELCIFDYKETDQKEDEPEYYILMSDDEVTCYERNEEMVHNIEEETDDKFTWCDVNTHCSDHLTEDIALKDGTREKEPSAKEPIVDDVEVSTPSKKKLSKDQMAVAYVDLSFATDEDGQEYVGKVCCLYENVKDNNICEREIDELCIFDHRERDQKENDPEYYILMSDDEVTSYERNEDEVNSGEQREEMDNNNVEETQTTWCDVNTHGCDYFPEEIALKDDNGEKELSAKEPTIDDVEVSTSSNKVSSPVSLDVIAVATLPDDKLVAVTQTGEIMIFNAAFQFLCLREFQYKFEDVTVVDASTLASTSGFCIYFFNLKGSSIVELFERTIDLEYSGCVTVHSIQHFQRKLAVVCNIQRVNSNNEPSVRFFDITGRQLLTIQIPTLHNPCRMTCSSNGKLIFICDSFSKTVVCFKSKGTMAWNTEDDKIPKDLVLVKDSMLYVLYEGTAEVVGLSVTTGKRKAMAETPPSLRNVPCKLEYQTENKQLIVCLEKICVGSPNFIFPLKIKKHLFR